MKIAVIGSRGLKVNNLEDYLPDEISELVSGGAVGIDKCAYDYALQNKIPIKIFLPQYDKYGKSAPLKRNIEIIDYSDYVLAFWDGKSNGTKFVINKCKEKNKRIDVYIL